ncbi:MAG: response regulator, partial [Bacteroidota bacterium]|nr:response regulator [Bacteroidota bacterium]
MTATPITGLKSLFSGKKEKSARKEQGLFEAIFEASEDAYFIYHSVTLEIIETNRKASTLFELPAEKELKGLYITQVMMRYLAVDSPNMERLMNQINENWEGEAEFLTQTKRRIYGMVNTNILGSQAESSEFRTLRIRDVSALAGARNEVKRAKISVEKAASSKARFLSTMSHELRTPLNGIIGAANLILADSSLKSDVLQHVHIMRYSSEHILDIINDILDFSKIDARKMEIRENPFKLTECIDNVVTFFAPQYKIQNIALVTDMPVQELKEMTLLGDMMKLSQVIKNLLSNALKFTLTGGVELRVAIKELNGSSVSLYFEVSDTGIGIPSEKHEEIFQAFSQIHSEDLKRKYEGTGLGLTISKRLVEMMGGTIGVESELDRGTRFFFTLPFKLSEKPVVSKSIAVADNEPPRDIRGLRVLVVEDNEINANILKSFLHKWQMQIKGAITGLHALELIKYHKFDLILMDLEMPEMNGYTALQKIREQGITIPVIAFTATLLENMDLLVKEAGFTDYVLKPFRPSELRKKI